VLQVGQYYYPNHTIATAYTIRPIIIIDHLGL